MEAAALSMKVDTSEVGLVAVVDPHGPHRLASFERIINPVIDLKACRADILDRSNGEACAYSAGRIAVDYHSNMKLRGAIWWRNADYLVQAALASAMGFQFSDDTPALWLRVYRHDGKRLTKHWQELQQIKNELVGEECEAVEIFPKESQRKDGENSYHLWVPLGWALPFGMPGGRSPTADGLPAISSRFVRSRAGSASGQQSHAASVKHDPYCRLIASGIDVAQVKAITSGRAASDGYMFPSGHRHVLNMPIEEKTGVESEGGVVEMILDAVEPHIGRPRVEMLNLLHMAPGDVVPEHVDPRQPNQVGTPTRIHLVIAAEPGCEFEIGGETIEHRPGDLWHIRETDRVLHSARNLSAGNRIIACLNIVGPTEGDAFTS